MNTFLNAIAKDLLEKYGNNLSEIVVVFPNKRASLFLNEELILQSGGKPVWSPQYMTISELYRSLSPLLVADQIKLVCELFKHYSHFTKSQETLDDFYGWGELMLSDFDDLDKNMGDYEKIFANTNDLHDFDSVDFLTEEQKELLTRFFKNFDGDHKSPLKENFASLWNVLASIYSSYREALRGEGIAYEGMLYRDVAEHFDPAGLKAKMYVFAGFNLLQKVEQRLIEELAREKKAIFYWDYDSYYMNNGNEAGKYISAYLHAFPNQLAGKDIYSNLTKKENITFLSASTEDIQARYISQWLTPERIKAGKRTAIVMCDEKILPTIIHCLPPDVKDINITTGYPLSQTLIATLVKEIFALKLSGSSRLKGTLRLHQVNSILHHPYMKFISEKAAEITARINADHIFYPTIDELSADENLAVLFAPLTSYRGNPADTDARLTRNKEMLRCILTIIKQIAINSAKANDNQEDDNTDDNRHEMSREQQLMQESVFRMHQLITRVNTLLESGELEISEMSLQSLVFQIVRSTNVPFHGEPIMGIQIMGVLETRLLDFDHMLILSANEGNIPKGVDDASFIPHSIRKAYGLTTVENKVGIFAYYFHRMMQRAGDVTFTYNNAANDTKTNEMSRFMMQLMAESTLPIQQHTMISDLSVNRSSIEAVEKTAPVIEKLNSIDHISPTALSKYLRCPLSFFYRFICDIKDEETNDEDEMDNRIFGLVFHKAAETLYSPFKGRDVTKEDLEYIRKDESLISRAIIKGFKEELFNIKDDRNMPALDGMQMVNMNIIRKMILCLIDYDISHAPFHIEDLEKRIYDSVSFRTSAGTRTLKVKGFIDRLDIVTGFNGNKTMRVVDYKTGASRPKALKSVEEIFLHEQKADTHPDYYLQTLLYSKILTAPDNGAPYTQMPVSPALLYPHFAREEGYNPVIRFDKTPVYDVKEYLDEYCKGLSDLLSEIFDETKKFEPATDSKQCQRCFYQDMCGKKK